MRKSIRKALSVFMIALFGMMLLTSCQHPSVSINTKPQAAKVFVSEQYVGESPVTQTPNTWPWETINVKVDKEGYTAQTRQANHSLNGTGVVVLVVGIFIWPVLLGLLAPGCWDLAPNAMDIQLEKGK